MPVLQEYKCPSCNGALEFDPSSQNIKCPWCKTEFDVSAFEMDDKSCAPDEMEWTFDKKEWENDENVCVLRCTSCSGEIIADGNTAATRCPWCDNPVVVTGRISGTLKPDYVIPFKLDKEAASRALLKHISKRLVPKEFKEEHFVNEIKGVYVPFWLYDTDVRADIRYKATTVRTWSDSSYRYTETCYFNVGRSGTLSFENIPHDASQKLANDITESLEPFDFNEAVDFNTAYLAGYLADKYDVLAEECAERINQRVKRTTEQEFRKNVRGYATVVCENSSVKFDRAVAKYVLYPVWLLNAKWNGENYTFAMNAQTGKFVGNLPLDRGAWWRWFLGVSAVSAAVALAVSLISFLA